MSVINNFSALTTTAWDILPAETASSFSAIIAQIESRIDVDRFYGIIDQFIAHRSDLNNPHQVVLSNTNDELIDMIYDAYTDMSTDPLSKADFLTTYYDQGLPFVEIIRRIVLNSAGYIDKVGPDVGGGAPYTDNEVPFDVNLVDPTISYNCSMVYGVDLEKNPTAAGSDPYYLSTSTALPHPHGTFLMRWKFPDVETYAEKTFFVLSNGTTSITIKRESGTQSVFRVILTEATILQPSALDRINMYLASPPDLPDYDGTTWAAALTQFGYTPVPAAPGMISVDPLRIRVDDGYIGVAYSNDILRMFYAHNGEFRAVSVYISGFTDRWTSYQIGIPITTQDHPTDSFSAASFFPVYMTKTQAAETIITL